MLIKNTKNQHWSKENPRHTIIINHTVESLDQVAAFGSTTYITNKLYRTENTNIIATTKNSKYTQLLDGQGYNNAYTLLLCKSLISSLRIPRCQ